MIVYQARQRICHSCSSRLLSLFANGFSSTAICRGHVGKLPRQNGHRRGLQPHMRLFSSGNVSRASVEHEEHHGEHHEVELPRTMKQMEAIVRQARQTFGETLPHDFLLPEEYAIYERLYGPPSATTLPEDVDLLQGAQEEDYELPENVLMRENASGELEEVLYDAEDMDAAEDLDEAAEVQIQTQEDFRTRMAVLRDIAAAKSADLVQEAAAWTEETDREGEQEEGVILEDQYYEDEDAQGYDEEDGVHRTGDSTRTHPLTAAGRFGTWPTTIQISKKTVTDPITDLLSDASNKHLKEVALKTFGGPGLPNSTATITRPNLKQRPIALEAKQAYMGDMECNAYMAAVMPGAYATVMSTLVEVRKRLGSGWLRSLMRKEGGPRVLDAGSGGAGVLAWREVLRAEWELMHPDCVPHDKAIPYGKSTVVTGSTTLRHRASHLLDNTTFIPRLPDYDPSRDHPSLESSNPQPRKQYDLILAPHTLWTLKEDYMRKGQVQNFWSLLDPKGGVLILAEKGVPRGFELIGGARETLLKYHVASPGAEQVEYSVEDTSENRFGPKEKGMIIAPCTNHGKCPMYITAGTSQGRKDFCHFSQRYLRPQYLQRILDGRDRNSEDITFSYVALQRGVDQREKHSIVQGQPATEAAFEGYEEAGAQSQSTERHVWDAESDFSHVSTLSLPRAILPPIKRRGHVVLDLCTPAGKIERWTVPKSFSKQAYRDARKSKWGDLWALGAKTRVQRNIRVGLKTANSQMKDIPEAEAAQMDDDDLTRKTRAPKSKFRKSPKKDESKLRH